MFTDRCHDAEPDFRSVIGDGSHSRSAQRPPRWQATRNELPAHGGEHEIPQSAAAETMACDSSDVVAEDQPRQPQPSVAASENIGESNSSPTNASLGARKFGDDTTRPIVVYMMPEQHIPQLPVGPIGGNYKSKPQAHQIGEAWGISYPTLLSGKSYVAITIALG